MLELSEWEGAIYGDSGTENCTQVLHHNQKCYTATRELSYTTTTWRLYHGEGNQPLLSASPVWTREDPCQEGKRTGWWGEKRETPRQMHHSFKRRAKHADVKINSQTEGERTALSPLPGCHSFSHFLSLKVKVKKPSSFHTSSRTSFTAHITTSFLVNRDSGLKASEATYNFVTL